MQIEVFFTTCKTYLGLVNECHSLSYDAFTVHAAIVFVRYMMIALEQHKDEDYRTLGEIFFYLTDELVDITFSESFGVIAHIAESNVRMYTIFQVAEEQMNTFIEMFIDRLSKYIQIALAKGSIAA